tara:strand:- start:163 stop:747 length:585 start_codon:yes stop_codon:yes gene_type:complete
MDEKALITDLINGNEKAFELIVSNYQNLMLSVARAIVGEAFADEVVQDAWISAIKALPKFEGRSSLKTWLLHIVSNGAKSRVRRENRMISLDDGWQSVSSDKFDSSGHRLDDVQVWEEATPEALLANDQLQAAIENTFQTLPPLQRAALTMYDMEGFKMEEVCNILDISASNARVLLHRARTGLHQCIDKFQDK